MLKIAENGSLFLHAKFNFAMQREEGNWINFTHGSKVWTITNFVQ